MTPTKDKWKRFAIDHHFSHDPTPAEAVKLFDALMLCDNQEKVEDTLAEFEAMPWSAYYDLGDIELAESVESMARLAQSVESNDIQ